MSKNISLDELTGMERSLASCLLLIDTISEMSRRLQPEETALRHGLFVLLKKLFYEYPDIPFYKFAELLSLAGSDLTQEEYQDVITCAFRQ